MIPARIINRKIDSYGVEYVATGTTTIRVDWHITKTAISFKQLSNYQQEYISFGEYEDHSIIVLFSELSFGSVG